MDRIEKLKEFLSVTPNDSFLQHALALEYLKMGDEAEARNIFEALLERDPGYVGSYYHLAKLFERKGDVDSATKWYQRGMAEAKKVGDEHAYSELRSAYEELVF